MVRYEWSINGIVFDTKDPASQPAQFHVRQGQPVALKFINETGRSHPMHLHGYSFQVIEINGKKINGALRDTILVTPKTSVTVAFDATTPAPGMCIATCCGTWPVGMATLVQYDSK
jgi:FtsP/CotA-like multicopper oxidase with cupredoxin domain